MNRAWAIRIALMAALAAAVVLSAAAVAHAKIGKSGLLDGRYKATKAVATITGNYDKTIGEGSGAIHAYGNESSNLRFARTSTSDRLPAFDIPLRGTLSGKYNRDK